MSEINTPLTCAFHPKRETQLRCNRCNRPICIKCANHTPTGYRCPECIRAQQKVFITTKWFDYPVAFAITGVISFLGSQLSLFLGFITIFIAMGAGFLVVWGVKKAINNRRSPLLKIVMIITTFLFSLPPIIAWVIMIVPYIREVGFAASGGIYSLIWDLFYSIVITSYVFYQLRK
ncbi:MAG: hypothetical protein GQ562_04510 [Anaerolineales bacterium]|nr:hypothetical protein [Anaerolineales bacterium]